MLGYCDVCDVSDETQHEEVARRTHCTKTSEFWGHLHQKARMRKLGLDKYYQLCIDEHGPYVVSHTVGLQIEEDLKAGEYLTSSVHDDWFEKEMGEQWQIMFGGGPDEWDDCLSKLSWFPRHRWQKIKSGVDKWRT